MKTGWVVLIALLAFLAGLFGGGVLGTAGGAVGGGLAGVCYTAQAAVREGLLSEGQRQQLLQALAARHGDALKAMQISGDIDTACRDLMQSSR